MDNIISIKYDEFKKKIKEENFIFYVGGQWCKNCCHISQYINEVAAMNSYYVYNLDPRDNNKEAIDDFRKCNNSKHKNMYKEFIDILGFENDDTVIVEDSNGKKIDTLIPKLCVPSIFAIKNKKIVYTVSEEYEEEDLNEEIILNFKSELQELINKL